MPVSRRSLLGAGLAAIGLGPLRSSPYLDGDRDGIPDRVERSPAYDRFLGEQFGTEEFEGLDPDRPDLLIDARYVGSATISTETKRFVRDRFRANGIYLQWLDYPERYPIESVREAYGNSIEGILWPYDSFYADEVDDILRDLALQVIILPDTGWDLEIGYSNQPRQDFDGMSFGNRCLVTATDSREAERVLVMHEIGHLALCHSDDPASVMARSPTRPRLTPGEWARLRAGLPNVRDTTGFDIAMRECLVARYRHAAETVARHLRDDYVP